MKLLTIVGTRPEAVKMAPVLRALGRRTGLSSLLVSTGQHRDLLDEPFSFFGLRPNHALNLMRSGEDPLQFLSRAVPAIADLLQQVRPDRVIVQGDTSSALAGARAASSLGIPVAHVEAGLRTYRKEPWPEEPFRVEVDGLADQLFAPTPLAARNLAAERSSGTIHVTGNSGVDALQFVIRRLTTNEELRTRCDQVLAMLPDDRPLVLVTLHRRESIGLGVLEVTAALRRIAAAGARIAMPLHPRPEISGPIRAALGNCERVHLLPPLPFPAMVRLMQRCALILTDSGGIQEEAPTLGKPVLVLRTVTERPEAVEAGMATLVGLGREAIAGAADAILSCLSAAAVREVHPNPYGDGRAARRIVAGLLHEDFRPFGRDVAPAGTPEPIRQAV